MEHEPTTTPESVAHSPRGGVARPFYGALRLLLGGSGFIAFGLLGLVCLYVTGTQFADDVPYWYRYAAMSVFCIAGLAGSVLLIFRGPKARILASSGIAALPVFLVIDHLLGFELDAEGLFIFAACLALLLLLNGGPMREHLAAENEPRFNGAMFGAIAKLLIATGALVGLGWAVVSQAREIKGDLQDYRHESSCESGNVEDCVNYGLRLLRRPDSYEDVVQGYELLGESCDDGNAHPSVCRQYFVETMAEFDDKRQGAEAFYRERTERLVRPQCASGDLRACFLLGFDGLDADDPLMPAIRDACREKRERHACWVWQRSQGDEPSESEANWRACQAGIARGCVDLLSDDFDPEKKRAILEEACRAAPSLPGCAGWATDGGEVPADLRLAICHARGLSCGDIEVPEDVSHRPARTAALAALDESAAGDPGLWQVLPNEMAYEEACDDDVAPACLASGLRLFTVGKMFKPVLPPRAEMESTFGKACELGLDLACVAYGVRLLDRPFGDPPDATRAAEAFDVACERGHTLACWLRPIPDDASPTNVGSVLEQFRDGCFAGYSPDEDSACHEYEGVLRFEYDVSPVAVTNRLPYPYHLALCRKDEPVSCWQVAWMWSANPTGSRPPLRIRAFDAAAKTCVGGSRWACYTLLRNARSWGGDWESRQASLVEQICQKNAEMCDLDLDE